MLQVSPAQKDPLDLPDPKERLVKESQDLRDHPDLQDLLAILHLVNQALQVDPANQAQQVILELKETLVHLVLREQGAHLDLPAALGLLAFLHLANLEQLGCLEQWDQEESKVLRDTQVCLESLGRKERGGLAFMDLRVRPAQLDLQDLQGHLASLELVNQVNLDTQVSQVSQAHLVRMVHQALKDHKDQKVRLEHPELEFQASQVKTVLQAFLVLPAPKVPREQLEHLVLPVFQVMASQVQMV